MCVCVCVCECMCVWLEIRDSVCFIYILHYNVFVCVFSIDNVFILYDLL